MNPEPRNPATRIALQRFAYAHLPPELQELSRPFAVLAEHLTATLPDSPDLTEGLRKLWEAKNCAVYAAARERAQG